MNDGPIRSRFPVAVLRYRDFRLLWAGQFTATLGSQMHAAALSWQVYQLTGSAVQLGLLGLVRAISLIAASFVGGAVADSRNRRNVLLVTQSVLLLLSMVLAVLTRLDLVSIVALYAMAALQAATTAFDGPARQALIPSLVSRQDFGAAISLNILAMSVARMAGPAVGGVSVAAIGVAGTYVVGGLSFIGVIAALLVMRTSMSPPDVRVSGVAAVVEGLQFIRRTPVIWGIMGLDFVATLLGSTVGLAPVFAEDVLRVGPQGYGLLLSAPAAGAVFGGMLVSLAPPARRPGLVVVASVAVYGLCLGLFGLSTSLWMALVTLAAAGAADSVSVAMRHTVRNLATPDALRGRVAASHSALAMGGPRLGEFQSGLTAAAIGPRWAMIAGGAAVMLVAGLTAWAVPAVARYRVDESDQAASQSGGRLAGRVARPPAPELRSGEPGAGQ
jgi:MFS family permease